MAKTEEPSSEGGRSVPSNGGRKKLVLKFHGKVLEQLGLQMYNTPVTSLAELVANAWDADAEKVGITLPTRMGAHSKIVITDDGEGMTFEECQDKFLNVGWNRRGDDPDKRTRSGRPVLGRKGIGKFAGFGIARLLTIDTISKASGERTKFFLDLDRLLGEEYVSTSDKPITVLRSDPPDPLRAERHGTAVELSRLSLVRRPSPKQFARSMARRFLLQQTVEDFAIKVNNSPIPEAFELAKVEFLFPRDYEPSQKPAELTSVDKDGWGTERLSDGNVVRWRVLFFKDTIDEPELQGIAVFAKGKVCQAPFLFNLSGGLGGQHGVQYLAGQVCADFIDSMPLDLIATERQRVRWEDPQVAPLEEWGQKRLKQLLAIWSDRRSAEKIRRLETKVSGFSDRLNRLEDRERAVVKRAILIVADIKTLTNEKFEEVASGILTAWEQGRLRGLIETLSESEEPGSDAFLKMLTEAQVLSALNVAEAVKTKLLVVGELKSMVRAHNLEKAVRDYIARHPWLISPQFETYRVETGVARLLADKRKEARLKGRDWAGRVDLALSSGSHLIVLEFMRPGLSADWDHVTRFERYVTLVNTQIRANTAGPFSQVSGYLVADKLHSRPDLIQKIQAMRRDDLFAMDWDTLITMALRESKEFLTILVDRAPGDRRLAVLLEE